MKVFLQNTATRRYCAGSAGWVADLTQAIDFGTVAGATTFALGQQLTQTQILLAFRGLPHHIPVPVLPEWCSLDYHRLQPD